MTTSYYADRANVSRLFHLHPDWTQPQLAQATGRSVGWVKKWLKRFREEEAQGLALYEILQGHSRARKHPPASTPPQVVERILALRDQPPEGLRRIPGPKALLYYLPRDPELRASQLPLPRSSRTIYRLLKAAGRIPTRRPRVHEPMERPAPLSHWQLDFKDVGSRPADPDGKRQHVVETFDVVDMGSSVLLEAQVRPDFTAETALSAVVHTFQTYGRPEAITVDRDVRWVGSPQGSDFPAALIRFCACLGIEVEVCAPEHPQENGFVERYNRTNPRRMLGRRSAA